jgi:hypothetical protein
VNIFVVDENPVSSAQDLPDKLVVKMPTESVQMLVPWLFNTYGIKLEKPSLDENAEKKFYGTKGFAHHPCSKWLYEDPANVQWLLEHAFALCEEYWCRYNGKYHGAIYALDKVRSFISPNFQSVYSKNHTPFVQAMPDKYKDPENAIAAYRNYLMGEKGYAEWRYCSPPSWWDSNRHQPVREKYLEDKEQKKLLRKNAKHSSAERSLQS